MPASSFVELVGDRPVALANVCQRRYEAMVTARAARDNAVAIDLRPLRTKIHDAAENYANLLLSTLPDGDEQWAKIVLTALRPMLSVDKVREQGEGDELEGEPVAEPIAEGEPNPLETLPDA